MARAAAVILLASILFPSLARADECAACACIQCSQAEPAGVAEAKGMIIASLTMTSISWLIATIYASQQDHFNAYVDTIPVVGALVVGDRMGQRSAAPGLFFSAATQAMGIISAVIAGAELADDSHRRCEVGVAASSTGGAMSLTMHF